MRVRSGLHLKDHDGKADRKENSQALTYFRDGNPVVWVFPSEGRIWKDRWVAFTNGDQFKYVKGSQQEVMKWANDYMLMV